MAQKVKVWFDPEGDYLEVRFRNAPGFMRQTAPLLATTVSQQESIQTRLARLEQEFRKVKRHVAAACTVLYQRERPC